MAKYRVWIDKGKYVSDCERVTLKDSPNDYLRLRDFPWEICREKKKAVYILLNAKDKREAKKMAQELLINNL